MPPKPHNFCRLLRCRRHGLRVHVWSRKFTKTSLYLTPYIHCNYTIIPRIINVYVYLSLPSHTSRSLSNPPYDVFPQRPYIGKSRKEIRDHILSKQIQIKRNDIPRGWTIEAADFVNKVSATHALEFSALKIPHMLLTLHLL